MARHMAFFTAVFLTISLCQGMMMLHPEARAPTGSSHPTSHHHTTGSGAAPAPGNDPPLPGNASGHTPHLGRTPPVGPHTPPLPNPWTMEYLNDTAAAATAAADSGPGGAPAGRRRLSQWTRGPCTIRVRNLCPNVRYFVLAYRSTRVLGGRRSNGWFSEGWFNLRPSGSVRVPEEVTTQGNLRGREWFIRFGDGIKLQRENAKVVDRETRLCIDVNRPFQMFTPFRPNGRVCRYDGTFNGRCGTCAAVGGTIGHGFYRLKPQYCPASVSWLYTFSPANRNCR